jgi:TonB family protein
VGVRTPAIVLSRALVGELDDTELDAALLHENAHRRRREPLRALVIEIVASLFVFYPLLGPIVRGLHRSAELVCDADAISRGARPDALVRAVARSVLHGSPVLTSHAAALGGRSPLRERVERIQDPRRYRTMRIHRLIVATLATAAAVVSFAPLPFLVGCTTAEESTPEATNAPETTAAVAFDAPPVAKVQRPPSYPDEAKESGATGTVFVKVTIDENGKVIGAVVHERSGEEASIFDEVSLAAAREWEFEPATLEGSPVRSEIVIPFKFQLN